MKKLFEIKDVDTGYGDVRVLRNINFTVKEKDFVGIIGPNGGGKTTLLKLILGLLKPYKGEVVYYFNDMPGVRNANIGYLPQFNETDKKFPVSVRDVVMSGLIPARKIFNRYSPGEKSKADELIERLGMREKRDVSIGELSGGELQRVFLARAIVSSPALLILDEPGTYVDNRFENELYELLRVLNDDMAILLVSHDLGIISAYVKTIACVNTYLTYHDSNVITAEELSIYNCPVDVITHGKVPHRVLQEHNNK